MQRLRAKALGLGSPGSRYMPWLPALRPVGAQLGAWRAWAGSARVQAQARAWLGGAGAARPPLPVSSGAKVTLMEFRAGAEASPGSGRARLAPRTRPQEANTGRPDPRPPPNAAWLHLVSR